MFEVQGQRQTEQDDREKIVKRYECKDQNGDTFHESDSWGLASTAFSAWTTADSVGAGIWDNDTKSWQWVQA